MTTAAEAQKAETLSLEQRLAGAKLLRLDGSKATTPARLELAKSVMSAADRDPLKYDAMLREKNVGILFASGALHFGEAV